MVNYTNPMDNITAMLKTYYPETRQSWGSHRKRPPRIDIYCKDRKGYGNLFKNSLPEKEKKMKLWWTLNAPFDASDDELEYIAEMVKQGYTEGELVRENTETEYDDDLTEDGVL